MPQPSQVRRRPAPEVAVVVVVAACLVGEAMLGTGGLAVDLLFQTFTVVGVLLRIRRPGNVIGTLFVVAGVGAAVSGLGDAVIASDRADPRFTDWQIHVVGAFKSLGWLTTVDVPLVFVLLLFPDGQPLSPRWRPVVRAAAGAVAMMAVALVTLAFVQSREEVEARERVFQGAVAHALDNIVFVGILASVAAATAGTVALVVRYRRGTSDARQQIKFVIYAGAVAIVCSVVADSAGPLRDVLTPLGETSIAVAVALAILRYRLYDIDRVVSRTVTYAVVTGLLGATYLAMVGLTTGALGVSSAFGVAASTLAVAAAFTPLRRIVQSRVDRQFNRERYDAIRTVDRFASGLRDSVDLTTVTADLGNAVQSTLAPKTVSLWLRAPAHEVQPGSV